MLNFKRITALCLCLVLCMVFYSTTKIEAESSGAFESDVIYTDIPDAINFNSIQTYGHVKRLSALENDLNTILFLNKDGTETQYLFSYPIKYIDRDGITKDISLDIAYDDANMEYYSSASNIKISFGMSLHDGISLSYDTISIKMVPITDKYAKASLSENSRVMSYAVDHTTSYEYSLTYTGFKEDIVVTEYTGQNEYQFTLHTNGLELINRNG